MQSLFTFARGCFGSRSAPSEAHRLAAELAEERELGRLREEMLSTVAHDLRTPLTLLKLGARELQRQLEQQQYGIADVLAKDVECSAHRIEQLLVDLLDFTRVECGKLSLNVSRFSVKELVADATEDALAESAGGLAEVDVEIPPDLVLIADRARLRSAIRNLLVNSARYGRPPVRLTALEMGDDVEIHVQDSGPGIPVAERELIFQRLERGSTATGTAGTGLGLYLSRQLVSAHGGSLALADTSARGADFVIRMPRVQRSGDLQLLASNSESGGARLG